MVSLSHGRRSALTERRLGRERDGIKADQVVHLDLALEILKSTLSETSSESATCRACKAIIAAVTPALYQTSDVCFPGEVRKALVTFLGKLNLPEAEETEEWKPKAVELLVASIRRVCPPI